MPSRDGVVFMQSSIDFSSFVSKLVAFLILFATPGVGSVAFAQEAAEPAPQQEEEAMPEPSEAAAPEPSEAVAPEPSEAAMPKPQAESAPKPAAGKREGVEEILVTGTHIKRSTVSTPTPTTIVDGDAILATGELNAVEMLNELPAVATGHSSQTSSYSFYDAGLSQIDLRNLGVRRTLVLLDGRRPVGTPDSDNFLSFDLSTLPTQLIERVEVITGGASAAYGSDAVAGVVNIITRKDFEGTEVNLQGGMADKGDGEQTTMNLLFGQNFADGRANAVLSANFYDFQGVWKYDRDFSRYLTRYVSNPANTGADDGIPDMVAMHDVRRFKRFNRTPLLRLPVNDQLQRDGGQNTYVTFDDAGNLKLFEFGPAGNVDNNYTDGGDAGMPTEDQRLMVPVRRYNLTGRYRHELTDSIRLNADVRYSLTQARDTIDSAFAMVDASRDVIYADNPYIKDDLRAILAGDPGDPDDDIESFTFWRHHREYGARINDIDRHFLAASIGAEGDLGSGWQWQAYYQGGGTNTKILTKNEQLDGKYIQALRAVRDPSTGEIVCQDPSDGCVPLNVLGPKGTMSPEAVDFVTADHLSRVETRQHIVSALLTGNSEALFSLPAGPVSVAVGLEVRQDKLTFNPSSVWEEATGFYATEYQPIKGTLNVREGFGEVFLPLVKDVPLVASLNLEGAVRYASYNYGGNNWSWKVGGDWAPVADFRLRTVYAQAVRAAGISELFNPGSRGATFLDDPCDGLFVNDSANRPANCQAAGVPDDFVSSSRTMTTLTYSSGNEDLEAETGRTWTLGGVLTPRFLSGLSLAVDFWDIVLDEAIVIFDHQTVLDNCYDAPSLNNAYCALVQRNPDSNIYQVTSTYINADRLEVRGIDVEANYGLELGDLFDIGRDVGLDFRIIASYLMRSDYYTSPDTALDEEDVLDKQAGEVGDPQWRGSLSATFKLGGLGVNWQTRYIGSQDYDVQKSSEIRDPFSTGSILYHDVNVRYEIEDFPGVNQRLQVYLGVDNVFDRVPPDHPLTSFDQFQARQSYYDPLGRFVYAGAIVKL